VRERAVGPVGEDLLGLGVPTVVFLSLEHHERGVGEDGVISPCGEQLTLPVRCLRAQVADAADDQPGGDRLARAGGERGVFHLRDLGVGDPAPELVIPDGARVADRRPGLFCDGGDRRSDLGVHAHGDREIRSRLAGGLDGRAP
jgi:hypothetical protein